MRKLPPEDIVVPLLLAVFELFVFGFALMGGAFAFAMIGSMADGALSFFGLAKTHYCQWGGWFVGFVLGGAGYWKKGCRRWKSYFAHWHADYVESEAEKQTYVPKADGKRTISINDLNTKRETAMSIAFVLFLAVLAGGIAACYAVLVWFFISYSPFAFEGWVDSIEPARQVSRTSIEYNSAQSEGLGVSTSHPTAVLWVKTVFLIVTPLVAITGTIQCLYFYFRNTRKSKHAAQS